NTASSREVAPPPPSTLFPYTTLFRSLDPGMRHQGAAIPPHADVKPRGPAATGEQPLQRERAREAPWTEQPIARGAMYRPRLHPCRTALRVIPPVRRAVNRVVRPPAGRPGRPPGRRRVRRRARRRVRRVVRWLGTRHAAVPPIGPRLHREQVPPRPAPHRPLGGYQRGLCAEQRSPVGRTQTCEDARARTPGGCSTLDVTRRMAAAARGI